MKKIAVYGSLLTKLHNHSIISSHIKRGGAKLLGVDILNIPYKMFDLGCYPGLIAMNKEDIDSGKLKNENILVEIYEIDDETNACIERLEGYTCENSKRNYYNKDLSKSKFGEVEIYIFNIDSYAGLEDQEIARGEDGIVGWKRYYLDLENKF
jgi:gamma-glutamylcyclotransferase (GGCT)/AIG2-like uncharacterized protein YtfP